MTLTMPGQLALNTAETAQGFVIHAIKTVICPERIHAILGVPCIVHKIERLMPLPIFRGKHDGMGGGHDLCESRRTTPVAGSATDHGVYIHQCHGCSRGIRISNRDIFPRGIFNRYRVFRFAGRRIRQAGRYCDWFKWRRVNRLYS